MCILRKFSKVMTFRIKKLDIFIAKQFGLLFVGTFFICQFVLMMQFVWRYVDELIGKGLSVEILAQFFWNMALMLVPQALPLAILLSSLITFGNLGESYELTAIKSAGISLMQSFRSLIAITLVICGVSFYFQNNIGPEANMKLSQLLISMKQKSPELMIPEGIFYDGIPNCNIYVQKKDVETGKLYGMMIYRMTGSYEDQAIILADSGMMQTTAEKKHLLLTLWSGEWFENMQSSEFGNSASVPYRRESFVAKQIVLDFDGDFNMQDAASLANNAKGKGLRQIFHDMDSINQVYDSIGRSYYDDAKRVYFYNVSLNKADSLNAVKMAKADKTNFDSLFGKKSVDVQKNAVNDALNSVQGRVSDLEFRSMITSDGDRLLRMHEIEAINKFTLALQCLLFFFIGAPLGAIIRKGGLGYPILISVLVFIVYYILFTLHSSLKFSHSNDDSLIGLANLSEVTIQTQTEGPHSDIQHRTHRHQHSCDNIQPLMFERSGVSLRCKYWIFVHLVEQYLILGICQVFDHRFQDFAYALNLIILLIFEEYVYDIRSRNQSMFLRISIDIGIHLFQHYCIICIIRIVDDNLLCKYMAIESQAQ
jgi:lipopolysaccharide export system permease protein